MIYSYSGLTPPAQLLNLIRHGKVAGVIFFTDNISSESQIAAVDRELQAANKAKTNPVRLPLLLMTDQEGGQVRRLPGAPLLSAKQVGEARRIRTTPPSTRARPAARTCAAST